MPSLQIDLNDFKLHLRVKNKTPLTLHFNSPSRRFYLSLIALVVHEMKKSGKIKSVPLQDHLHLLALLNETIGGAAGSSNRGNMLHRIYTKWKDALPNLEEAPLFKILGRNKEEAEGAIGKIYSFTDEEKDGWANLFEYTGSEENVRLRFAIDKIGVGLAESEIIFGDSPSGDAWEQFLSGLKKGRPEKSESVAEEVALEEPAVPLPSPRERKPSWFFRHRWSMLILVIGVAAAAGMLWKQYWNPVPIPVASKEKMAFSLPDKPSIAVLPFTNRSGEKKQEYLCDGLAEGIIDGLAKSDSIFVIARNSTFTYKGKAVKVKQVAEEMGVQYVMEGSVQSDGKRVRINAQLIDALSGRHLFSERYDRDLKDFLTLQDEITMRVLKAVQVKLIMGEGEGLGRGTKNLEAYLRVMQAKEYMEGTRNKERIEKGRQLLEEALALDPKYAGAYAGLGGVQLHLISIGASESPRESLHQALEFFKKAVALDDSHPEIYRRRAFLYMFLREYDKGLAEARKAVSLAPNSAMAYYALGWCLNIVGRPQEAIPCLQKSLRLSPIPVGSNVLEALATSYILLGRYEEAIAPLKKELQIFGPDTVLAHIYLARAYVGMGREKEARAEGEEVLRIDPNFTVDRYVNGLTLIRDQAVKNRLAETLRKAGLK